MVRLDRDGLLEAPLNVERVELDSGDYVFVREMTVAQNRKFIKEYGGETPHHSDFRERLIAICLSNEHGILLCSDGDVESLGECPVQLMNELMEHCLAVNGMTEDAQETIEKNSEPTPSSSSSTS